MGRATGGAHLRGQRAAGNERGDQPGRGGEHPPGTIVVADTSGIIAAADRRAPESVRVSSLVLAEVDHLAKVRFGTQARHVILGNIITQALEPFFSVAEHECAKRGPAEWVQAVGFKSGPRVPAAAVPLPGVAAQASAGTC